MGESRIEERWAEVRPEMTSELPVVGYHPADDEVVVVGVQGADDAVACASWRGKGGGDEGFGYESGLEKGREQDRGTVRGGPTGDYEDAATEGVGGGEFEVVPFEVEAADDVPEGGLFGLEPLS